MIKIMIADDQELIRESLKIILSTNAEFQVIATASSGNEVMELLHQEQPDVILMDMRMPDMDGAHCTKCVKEAYPNIKVIILTTFDDDEYVYSALKYGASGYLLKGVSLEELSNAVKTVLQGGGIFNPDVAGKAIQLFHRLRMIMMKRKSFSQWRRILSSATRSGRLFARLHRGFPIKRLRRK